MVGKVEVAEVVDPNLHLEAILGHSLFGKGHHSSIIYQIIDLVIPFVPPNFLLHELRKLLNRSFAPEIQPRGRNFGARELLGDLSDSLLILLDIPCSDDHSASELSQPPGGFLPDPCISPSDDCDFAIQVSSNAAPAPRHIFSDQGEGGEKGDRPDS